MIYIRQERRRRHETLGWTGWNGHTLQDTAVLGGAALVSIFLSLGKLSLIPTPTNSYCLQRASIHCELSLDVHIARANEIGVDNKLRMQRNDALIKGHLNAAFYFCTNGKPASERCGTFWYLLCRPSVLRMTRWVYISVAKRHGFASLAHIKFEMSRFRRPVRKFTAMMALSLWILTPTKLERSFFWYTLWAKTCVP